MFITIIKNGIEYIEYYDIISKKMKEINSLNKISLETEHDMDVLRDKDIISRSFKSVWSNMTL